MFGGEMYIVCARRDRVVDESTRVDNTRYFAVEIKTRNTYIVGIIRPRGVYVA